MIKKLLLFMVIVITMSCQSNTKENKPPGLSATETDETPLNDNYSGDSNENNEKTSYNLGNITFAAEGNTYVIDKFGLDPYTAITWFTPKSGIDPMASVVFKSEDFKNSILINFKDFDAMQTSYSGQKEIVNIQPIVSFVHNETTYMFSSGTISIEQFSRKTGEIKLKVIGKCNKVVMADPSAMKQNVDATLEINAIMPFASVDGMSKKTEAANKLSL